MFKKLFIVVSMALASEMVLASAQNCEIVVNRRAVNEINISDFFEQSAATYPTVGLSSAKECYDRAVELAANMENQFPELEGNAVVVAPREIDGKVVAVDTGRRAHVRLVVRWIYNDSIVADSAGTVTRYTKDCVARFEPNIESHYTGNKRYWAGCSKF